MKEKTITVSHEVSPEYGKCSFGGDFSRHGFCGMNGTGVCGNADCENYQPSGNYMEPPTCAVNGCTLYEAPQSWCYVEERRDSE